LNGATGRSGSRTNVPANFPGDAAQRRRAGPRPIVANTKSFADLARACRGPSVSGLGGDHLRRGRGRARLRGGASRIEVRLARAARIGRRNPEAGPKSRAEYSFARSFERS